MSYGLKVLITCMIVFLVVVLGEAIIKFKILKAPHPFGAVQKVQAIIEKRTQMLNEI